MNLFDLLRAGVHIVSVVGSGGKSTLVVELASELNATTIIATTTHMFAPPNLPLLVDANKADISEALKSSRVICTGQWEAGKVGTKLCAPTLSFLDLAKSACYVLVEADGAKRLPLKAHAAHEPAIAEGTDETIQVLGASGFGKPVAQVVHRPEIFCELGECASDALCTPDLCATVIAKEHARKSVRADILVINQVEDNQSWEAARHLHTLLRARKDDIAIVAGSIRAHRLVQL